MPRDRQLIGHCPQCNGDRLACNYNHFERDKLVIDSWEHKCPDCGYRETRGFRNDEEDSIPAGVDPAVCPYCGRRPSADG